jgi:TRAP-type C4-dicarboxylate transport system substrate-binding protein
MINFGVQAHHAYVSMTGHLLGIAVLLINWARFEELSESLQQLLISCSKKCERIQRQSAIAEDAACCRLLSDAGVGITEADDIDLAAFRSGALA